MLACGSCRRFVVEQAPSCPFCGTALVSARAPGSGFLVALLGVCLAACTGGDDTDSTSVADDSATVGTTMADDSMTGADTAGGSGGASTSGGADQDSGPLYGPVTTGLDSSGGGTGSSGVDSGTVGATDSGGTDSGGTDSGGTDSGGTGATIGSGGEDAQPLYGPVMTTGADPTATGAVSVSAGGEDAQPLYGPVMVTTGE
ncbi:MAG: hypothetical protein AAF721_14265 [Myxococcota bacterium]